MSRNCSAAFRCPFLKSSNKAWREPILHVRGSFHSEEKAADLKRGGLRHIWISLLTFALCLLTFSSGSAARYVPVLL
jgi:hypothetical protein